MRVAIKFLHGWNVYQPGEVARFEEDIANKLVAKGYAVFRDGAIRKDSQALKEILKAENKAVAGPKETVRGEIASMIGKIQHKTIVPIKPKADRVLNLATGESKEKEEVKKEEEIKSKRKEVKKRTSKKTKK